MSATSLDQIVSLAKQRGFIFPGSEIYGGLANTWDYGPIGVELKNNVKKIWWDFWVTNRDDVVGVDAAILMNPRVWEASGHVSNFADPLVDCKSCKKRHRGDKLIEEEFGEDFYTFKFRFLSTWMEKLLTRQEEIYKKTKQEVEKKALENFKKKILDFLNSRSVPSKKINFKHREIKIDDYHSLKAEDEFLQKIADDDLKFTDFILKTNQIKCPDCGECKWVEAKQFNLMFKTQQGVTEDSEREIFMRPETAQGIFVNFKNVLNATRKKLPFGIAQIGKAFRNEITPGNFTFRTREFEQMEVEYFCAEKNWKKIYPELEKASWDFFAKLGIDEKSLRWRQHDDAELSHYSSLTKDVEYKFPWGWGELQGLAYRSNYDLKQHEKFSGESLEYLDNESGEKFVPHCIEPSFGCDRTVLTVLLDAYCEDEVKGEKRVVMKFDPKIAPIKVAILPLSRKENLTKKAREIYDILRREFRCEYDETQSIGKRYRRQDEIGTPLCVTVDFGTIGEDDGQSKKDCVTVRDRDSLEQVEVPIKDLPSFVAARIKI